MEVDGLLVSGVRSDRGCYKKNTCFKREFLIERQASSAKQLKEEEEESNCRNYESK